MWRSNYTRYHCTRRFIARSEFPPLSSQSPGSLNVTENESERDFKKRLLETVNDEYLEWDCGYVIYRFADVGNSSLECECLIAIGELTPVQPVLVNADTLLATPLTECECVVFEHARKDGFLVRFDMSELLSETAESVEKKVWAIAERLLEYEERSIFAINVYQVRFSDILCDEHDE